jgi:hypothetical protein
MPTIGEMHRAPGWLWVSCTNHVCTHREPVALAPLVIRWGKDAPMSRILERFHCSKCGRLGAHVTIPAWQDMVVGVRPFPVEQARTFSRGQQ